MPPEMARLTELNAQGQTTGDPVIAHFNPQSLQLNYRATGTDGSSNAGGAAGTQTGASSQRTGYTVNLSALDLYFDTSESGADVRGITLKIAKWIQNGEEQRVPNVQFQWGTFLFKGVISSMAETLDYFSDAGVPLRAKVTLTLDMNEAEVARNRPSSSGAGAGAGAGAGLSAGLSAGFSAGISGGLSAGVSGSLSVGASAGFSAGASAGVGTTPLTFSQSGESMQSLAGRAGVDWKAAASANGIDNPRLIPPGTVLNLNVKK